MNEQAASLAQASGMGLDTPSDELWPANRSTRAVSSVGRAHPLQGWGHKFESCTAHQSIVELQGMRGRSSVWLERVPVTHEVAGSSPVVPAIDRVRNRRFCDGDYTDPAVNELDGTEMPFMNCR